jgi:hypothetical protein
MSTHFFPQREADLVTFAANFDAKITANPTSYGLTADQATAFNTLYTAFRTAYQLANNPDTRSPSNIVAKDTAKEAMIENIRQLARIVQAVPDIKPSQLRELGLTVRDPEPTPVPVPDDPPVIDIIAVEGRTVHIRLHDINASTKRGKPAGVYGATVLSYVGDTPPDDLSSWKFEGNITRTSIEVDFPPTIAPGTKVWLTAFWINPRLQSGPATTPVDTYLEHGGVSKAA